MLTLKLLGEMELWRGQARLSLPRSKKTRALLAYLAVNGRQHRRERLCDLLWELPDDPRGALRWSLSKLRALVDEPDRRRIAADREHVAFDAAMADIDVTRIRGLQTDGVDAASTADLRAAAAIFRGEFLEDLTLADLPDFLAWCTAERAELNGLRMQILRALTARLADQPWEALPFARRLVQLDPDDAASAAQLRTLLHAAGSEAPAGSADAGTAPAPTSGAPERDADRFGMQQEIRFCRASDGARIAYATVGDGPALVKAANWLNHLEHDWQSPVWRHLLEALADDHFLVRYDERGNGLSDWDVPDISFDAFVDDLEAVVEATGVERFALLGISQGCAVSVAYAVLHPERVSHLVLYGGFPRGWRARADAEEIERREALLTLARQGWGADNPAFRQVFASLYLPDAKPAEMDAWNELLQLSTSPENAVTLMDVFSRIDVSDLLPRVTVPTLVLHARNESAIPFAMGREFAMNIPGARFVPLESRNHVVMDHEPAWPRLLEEIRAFLASPPAG